MLGRANYQYVGELHKFITADGVSLNLSGNVYEMDFGGFGLANFDYQTRSGYKQSGSTEIDFRASDRQFNVNIYRKGMSDRAQYWTERKRLIDIFRPNRGGQLTMQIITESGEKRSIKCRCNGGVEFSNENANENNWDLNCALSLVAFDPTWFDSDATLFEPVAESDEQLVFPITFDDENIYFGTSGQIYTTDDITYNGNWRTYPLITITGPYSSCVLTNTSNDVEIQLLTAIATGEQRIINTEPGNVYVIDENGDSVINELSKDSNFVDFAVFPDSELPSGAPAQQILARITGAVVGETTFSVQYYERYIGI